MNGQMSDDEIRKHIGLSEDELNDVETKFDAFVKGLKNPRQQRAFKEHQEKRLSQAAAELGQGVTPKQLGDVLRKNTRQLEYICVFCLNNGDHKHR